jgi:hypothetical protein
MNNQEYPENNDPYKFYFQIDTEWVKKYMDSLLNKIEYKWISKEAIEDALKNLSNYNTPLLPDGFSPIALPVNSSFSSTADDKKSLYLGNNYWNEGVWKKQHFIQDKLQNEYVKHLQSNAGYFLSQPKYYKGLYEILN